MFIGMEIGGIMSSFYSVQSDTSIQINLIVPVSQLIGPLVIAFDSMDKT